MSVSRLALAFCAAAFSATAATSTAWEVTGFTDLLKGRLSGISLTADGALELGPAVRFNATLDQPALWSIVAAPDAAIYASTGHQGKVFRIGSDGRPTLIWTAQQTEVFALAPAANGALYAGTSPNGGLYRIENGRAQEIWHSPAKYIWAIEPGRDGVLYVATGDQGRIYRIDPSAKDPAGTATVYYETGQANVTSLATGRNGHLYAGTDPNGLLYDIPAARQGTVLYDSTLPEIRSIAVDPSGSIYAAAMGGAVSTRSATAAAATTTSSAGPVVATTPTVITVTEASQNTPASDAETVPKPTGDQSKAASAVSSSATTSTTAVVEVSGVEKSAIYRIGPDHTVETLRSSKEDNVFDLLLDGDSLLFSTDDNGRVYRLTGHKTTLVVELGSGETMRLLHSRTGLYAGMSNPARLYSFGPVGAAAGSYESQVHDSTSVARWGHLQWRGSNSGASNSGGSNSAIAFRTRTGNTARPDPTWSPWSALLNDSAGALIKSPSARFIQWRAEWPSGSTAALTAVDVPYLPQNTPPVIHSVSVTSVLGSNTAKAAANVTSTSSAYSITVTDTGQPAPATSTSSSSQTVSRLQTTQTQVSWQADDPDSDKLVYSVYFRAEDEKEWQLIRSRMFENTLLLDPDVLADGRYYFRIVASDAPSNATEYAHQTELISPPVLIDNSPPTVTIGEPHRSGAVLDIDVEASDKTSPLRLCEYSVDAGFWQPIEALDRITDSPHERFHLHLDKLRPGEHLLVFRVYDTANNAGLARAVLR
jgi:hypothetical protein